MTTKVKPCQIVVLVVLVLLPFFFPYGCRDYYLIPYDTKYLMEVITLNFIIYNVVILPYWFMVGAIFARWVKPFGKAFVVANLPIFFNVIGESIYFGFLNMKQNTYPWLEYLIGSHIDKFNLLMLTDSCALMILSILISAGFLLTVFITGYKWVEKEFPRKKVSDGFGEEK